MNSIRIAVVGSGTMGNGIAHVFALRDFPVNLIDVGPDALETALSVIGKNLDRQVKKGLISPEDRERALSRISTSTHLADAVSKAALVVEAATENPDVKAPISRASWARRRARIF